MYFGVKSCWTPACLCECLAHIHAVGGMSAAAHLNGRLVWLPAHAATGSPYKIVNSADLVYMTCTA